MWENNTVARNCARSVRPVVHARAALNVFRAERRDVVMTSSDDGFCVEEEKSRISFCYSPWKKSDRFYKSRRNYGGRRSNYKNVLNSVNDILYFEKKKK